MKILLQKYDVEKMNLDDIGFTKEFRLVSKADIDVPVTAFCVMFNSMAPGKIWLATGNHS